MILFVVEVLETSRNGAWKPEVPAVRVCHLQVRRLGIQRRPDPGRILAQLLAYHRCARAKGDAMEQSSHEPSQPHIAVSLFLLRYMGAGTL